MGYFGGLGAGKGWHKFYFCITPEELRAVLESESLLLVTTDAIGGDEERHPSVESYLAAYRAFTTSIPLHDVMPWETFSPLRVSATHPGFTYTIDRFTDCEGESMSSLEPEEPVIAVSPFQVHPYRGTLSVSFSGPSDTLYFGLEMDFPRVVSYEREDYEVEHDTSDTPNAALYARLTARIRSITSPCRIESPSRVHRTPIRISPAMREVMRGCPSLARHGLQVL